MACASASGDTSNITSMHEYTRPQLFFTGDYTIFEEWVHKFLAYIGLVDLLMEGTNDDTQERKCVQLSRDIHYTCS